MGGGCGRRGGGSVGGSSTITSTSCTIMANIQFAILVLASDAATKRFGHMFLQGFRGLREGPWCFPA